MLRVELIQDGTVIQVSGDVRSVREAAGLEAQLPQMRVINDQGQKCTVQLDKATRDALRAIIDMLD